MATPFIDVLTDEQRTLVARKSKGENRPSYFSAEVATAQSGEDAGMIKISEDLEAVLILLPAQTKQGLLDFIQTSLKAVSSIDEADYALFTEMLAVRQENYQQINADSGRKVLDYDNAWSQVIQFVENRARQNLLNQQERGSTISSAQATAVVIPDMSTLFAALAESYDRVARPDELAVHDRIVDSGFVYAIQNVATNRSRELSSWVGVIQTYMV